jgi:hypothetical protein
MPPFLSSVKKSIQRKRKRDADVCSSDAKMDAANKALCFALRRSGTKLKDIRKLVKKTDGKRPSLSAISQAARSFNTEKQQRGRKLGKNKTTKEEERKVIQVFHKLRPPGHGVDSRVIHGALPKKLRKKIGRRTIIRRLAEKGYKPEKKLNKTDPGPALKMKRCSFGRKHEDKNGQRWKSHLQACGDFKDFTFYPKELQPQFKKLRASWTYMKKSEKKLPAFVRPKRWFPKKDWKKVKKQKVFGMTTSNGKSLAFLIPSPWSAEQWAVLVETKVNPFLKRTFPRLTSFHILFDGEPLLHAPAAQAAYRKAKITTEPWPKYSPDLNPQEQVWAWAEPQLRRLETGTDAFPVWQKKILKAVHAYPSKEKLIPSMARRCKALVERSGAMLDD